jgi:hypothetical protein
MPMSDYLAWIHGKADRSTGTLVPVRFVTAGTTYSEDQLDFGTIATGNEGIANLLGMFSNGAIRTGLHVVVTEAYNGPMTSATIFINTSATNALITGTVLTERVFTVAQLAVLGAHYFIPLPPGGAASAPNILEFLAAGITVAGGTPTTGSVDMWFGPDADGAF